MLQSRFRKSRYLKPVYSNNKEVVNVTLLISGDGKFITYLRYFIFCNAVKSKEEAKPLHVCNTL